MNKKIFWILGIIVILAAIFYKLGFWYDIGYYLKLPGYNMPRRYCDPGPCQPKVEDSQVSFSDGKHIEFKYSSDWQVGTFANFPNEYTLQPTAVFVPESRANSILVSITGHCMNTQCLTDYSLDDMVKQFDAKIINTVKAQNVTGYEVQFSDQQRGEMFVRTGYMFIKGKDLVIISTDTHSYYMKDIIPTLKLLASD